MTAQQLQQSERLYRCKTKDKDLYERLAKIIARFITFDRLKEGAHGMDTNVNESLNNTISYFAPKNRVSLLRNKVSRKQSRDCCWCYFPWIRTILSEGISSSWHFHHSRYCSLAEKEGQTATVQSYQNEEARCEKE